MISIFKNLNKFAGRSKLLDGFAILCAVYLLYILLLFLAIFAFIEGNWKILFYPLLSGLLAILVIDKIIYIFYKKKRPAESLGAKVLIVVPKNPSFPSRHASISFAISSFLFFYNIQLAIIFICCACLISLARVFCGVHWFKDILAGAFVGIFSTLIIQSLLKI